jgi:hypothetical protein
MSGVIDRASISTLITLLLLALSLLLRSWASLDAFWLDEIWSYYLSTLVNQPVDILTEIRIDNNHPLNTFYMYLVGDQANWAIYRLPALLLGTATVAILGLSSKELNGTPWITMLLGAVSLPLIQYSSEARGYGPAAFFAVTAWYIYAFRLRVHSSNRWLMVFWLCCILGILSHATFLFVFLALCIIWCREFLKHREHSKLINGLRVFTLPGLFILAMCGFFYSQLSPGGDQSSVEITTVLLQLTTTLTGSPNTGLYPLLATALVMVLVCGGISLLPDEHRWFFAALIMVPVVLLLVYQPRFFFLRYLLVCIPFFYLLVDQALSGLLKTGTSLNKACAAFFLLYIVAGSGLLVKDYLRWGKGDYPAAIEQMHRLHPEEIFTVGSDFDFRNKSILEFYARLRPDGGKLTYIEEAHLQTEPTDLFITHDQQQNPGANKFIRLENNSVYKLIGIYPYAGLSGWNWYIYSYTDKPVTTP